MKLPLLPEDDKAWHSKGLRFECTGCGACCTGSPGVVWVTEEEIASMAAAQGMPVPDFTSRYVRKVGGRLSLKERSRTYDCVFLSGKRCEIYDVRPTQCRTYPFWPKILASPETWKAEAAYCEGIRPDAPWVAPDRVAHALAEQTRSEMVD